MPETEANCVHGVAMDIYCEQCAAMEKYYGKDRSVGKPEELMISDAPIYFKFSKSPAAHGGVVIKAYFGLDTPRAVATIDRNQAHLLMLYLQEHLGYNKVEVTEPKMWLCNCGKYHMKDFVCTMLK